MRLGEEHGRGFVGQARRAVQRESDRDGQARAPALGSQGASELTLAPSAVSPSFAVAYAAAMLDAPVRTPGEGTPFLVAALAPDQRAEYRPARAPGQGGRSPTPKAFACEEADGAKRAKPERPAVRPAVRLEAGAVAVKAERDVKPDLPLASAVKRELDVPLKGKCGRKRKLKCDLAPDPANPDGAAPPKRKRHQGQPPLRPPLPVPTPPLPHRPPPESPKVGLARVAKRVQRARARAHRKGRRPYSHYSANLAACETRNGDMPAQLADGRWFPEKPRKDKCYTSCTRGGKEARRPMALALHGILYRAFGSTQAASLLHAADAATHAWCQARPPHIPSANSRFAHLPHDALRAEFEAQGEAYGVLHFADWLEQGHPDKGVQSSVDLNTDRNWKTRAKMRWFRALRPVWPVVEEALKALDEDCHKRYKAAAVKLEEDSYLQLNLVSPRPHPPPAPPVSPTPALTPTPTSYPRRKPRTGSSPASRSTSTCPPACTRTGTTAPPGGSACSPSATSPVATSSSLP